MTIQRRQPEGESPERLPQRWVLILITASFCGLAIGGLTGSVPAGAATALGLAGLLHKIMK
ncbi:hypothetical protein ITP53_32695 [Nonomuraea sp. K274]|uniref:Uncharacterized protein n=1 Tax=Nonomuraea cypriaca TaxID=1187855 RepID=A0A931F422_9ACTN|nr:hypothetical protein [Nonomuraea cypriaca]MBF8190388.1 hypothetical protein [Nonomuraea cypriaca]